MCFFQVILTATIWSWYYYYSILQIRKKKRLRELGYHSPTHTVNKWNWAQHPAVDKSTAQTLTIASTWALDHNKLDANTPILAPTQMYMLSLALEVFLPRKYTEAQATGGNVSFIEYFVEEI